MDELCPGDIVSVSKDHRPYGIKFLESGSDKKRFKSEDIFLVLQVFNEKIKVVTIFCESNFYIGTFYKSWVQKSKKFIKK